MSIKQRIEKAEKTLQLTGKPVVVSIVMFGEGRGRQSNGKATRLSDTWPIRASMSGRKTQGPHEWTRQTGRTH